MPRFSARRTILRRPILICLALGCSLPAVSHADPPGERAGVPCVSNPATPRDGTRTVALNELWRFSSEDDNELLFGRVQDVLADETGNFYLLDRQLAQVHVFSPDGRYLRSLSHEGDGPGETRNPTSILLLPSGALGIVQAFPARIVTLDLENRPLSPIELRPPGAELGTNRFALCVRSRGGTLAYAGRTLGTRPDDPSPRDLLVTCDLDGREQAVVLQKESADVMSTHKWIETEEYFVGRRGWTIGPEGNIYAAPERDIYAVHVFAPDGKRLRIFERDYVARLRNEAEKADMGIQMEADGQEIPVDNVIADRDPAITRIHVTADGETWVLHSLSTQDLPDGILQRHDVFDREGRYIREVALSWPERRNENDMVFYPSDERLIVVRGFDPRIRISIGGGGNDVEVPEEERPPLEVICYALSDR